jgi:tyrosinase
MSPAFVDRILPDGKENPLWSKRARASGGNFELDSSVVSTAALSFRNFTNSRPGVPSGFGGPMTGFNPGGGDNGGIENIPHNRIHVRIGGDTGFMSDPSTAALDPIFWLHHANIDRMWEVWRNQGPQFRDPDDES